jgi:hypothetical protein
MDNILIFDAIWQYSALRGATRTASASAGATVRVPSKTSSAPRTLEEECSAHKSKRGAD